MCTGELVARTCYGSSALLGRLETHQVGRRHSSAYAKRRSALARTGSSLQLLRSLL